MTPFEFKHFYSLKSSGLDASLKFRAHQCQARFFLKSCFVVETCFGETQETKGNAANTGKGVGKLPVLPFCWCFSNSWTNDYFPFGKASFSGVQYNRGQVSVFTKNFFFENPKSKMVFCRVFFRMYLFCIRVRVNKKIASREVKIACKVGEIQNVGR